MQQPNKPKITIIKKGDKEGQKALAIATRNQFLNDTKPLYFAKHWR